MKLRSGKYLSTNTAQNTVLQNAAPSPDKSLETSLISDTSLVSDASLISDTSLVSDTSTTSSSPPPTYYDPADNYDIEDMESGDETDEEDSPQQTIPDWVANTAHFIRLQLKTMDHTGLFGPIPAPNLEVLFRTRPGKFKSRTSSAVWSTVPVEREEVERGVDMDFSTLTIEELSD